MASTVWRGYLAFGLITVPIRLFRGARPSRIPLRQVARSPRKRPSLVDADVDQSDAPASAEEQASLRPTRSLQPLRGAKDNKLSSQSDVTLTPVHRELSAPGSQLTKAFEYSRHRYVEVAPEELERLKAKTSTQMAIEEFVHLSEIDPIYFETSYYVIPEEIGEKAYALLFRSLLDAGLVAIAQVAMHGRELVVVIRAGRKGLIAHTMFYDDEIHSDEEFHADTSLVSAKELGLAGTLIQSLRAPFDPEKYRDTYRDELQSLITAKVPDKPASSALVKSAARGAVVDITTALQRSLEALKKPAASEPKGSRKAPKANASARPSASSKPSKN